MRNKIGYFLLTSAIAVIVILVARQRSLNELRADIELLRHQAGAQAAMPESALATEVQSTNSVAELNPGERRELLRLRGQIQPLRDELQDMSKRVALLNQPRPQSGTTQFGDMPPEPKAEMQAENDFRGSEPFTSAIGLAFAMRKYLQEHAGELPGDLTKVEALADPPLPEGVGQRFELMRSDAVPAEGESFALIAREKDARQLTDGKWVRIYLHANGGTALAGPVDQPDWPAWERLQEAVGKATARKKQRQTQR